MGTNYYLYPKKDCECCGRAYEPLHIGKSSYGWCFSLHVIPDENINDLDDWKILWNNQEAFIKNEYGEKISITEMEDIITKRSGEKGLTYESDSWYIINYAEPGPNNLARHKLSNHCIKHGIGTWDCIIGEFS